MISQPWIIADNRAERQTRNDEFQLELPRYAKLGGVRHERAQEGTKKTQKNQRMLAGCSFSIGFDIDEKSYLKVYLQESGCGSRI